MSKRSSKPTTTTSTSPNISNQIGTAGTITYTGSGFNPTSLTVWAGDKITIQNMSSQSLQFESGPHPEHTEDPELNIGLIPGGRSATATVNKTGTFSFHNHLNSSESGTITIQQ